jgi:protein-S-isoprenylcysteine O-methyltransferase Ste14
MKSKFLVFMQFFIIFMMILPLGQAISYPLMALSVFLLGVVIGILALYENRFGNFNIRPDIKEDGELITSGIYSLIRHPMYVSVLLMMAAVVFLYPMRYEYVLYGVLISTLLIKLHYEESMWKCESQEYREYCKSTKKILPFIY